jgi:hypothetical protein
MRASAGLRITALVAALAACGEARGQAPAVLTIHVVVVRGASIPLGRGGYATANAEARTGPAAPVSRRSGGPRRAVLTDGGSTPIPVREVTQAGTVPWMGVGCATRPRGGEGSVAW